MASVAYTELIERAKSAADMHDEFVNTAKWLYFANSSLNKLWVKLIRSGFPPAVSYTDITITGATSYTIAEPSAIIAVYEMQSATNYYRLPIKPRWAQYSVSTGTHPREVYVYPSFDTGLINIVPYPTPSAASASERKLVVVSVPKPNKLVSGTPASGQSNSVTLPFGWEEYIVQDMAKQALGREETINPVIINSFREVEEMIDMHVHDYIMRQANTVDDYNRSGPSEYVNYMDWFYV